MKKIKVRLLLITALAVFCTSNLFSQSVAINTDGTTAHSSAILDIKSTTKGMLPPRMSTLQRTAITTPAAGLLVFDTDTNSLWFYNGSAWNNIAASGALGWLLTGNGSTNPATQFIGTIDNQPLRFKVNNIWAGEIGASGFNTFLGLNAGTTNNSGAFNTAYGAFSLSSNTIGINNTANGALALASNTTSNENTAIGNSALYSQSFSNGGANYNGKNTAIGYSALYHNNPTSTIDGIQNTAIGHSALYLNTKGYSNTATGYASLYSNSIGIANTATGQGALYANNDGTNNTANGYSSLSSNSSGIQNTAMGSYSLLGNTNGGLNTAVGYSSLSGNTTGNGNVAVGYESLGFNTNGLYNTAVGYGSLLSNGTGSGNTALGYLTGPNSSNLSNTTCIGNGATATNNNQMVLGNAAVTEFYCYAAFIGTTANAPNLTVLNTGQIVRSTSSRRYKKDIVPLEINTGAIYKLRPVSYNSLTDNDRHFGLIAEEVAEVIPELASYSKEKDVIKGSTSEKMIPDAVQYPLLSVLLLQEVQKHQQTIQTLQQQIDLLMKRIENLEKK